ncbi:aldose 1-epimerase [Pseudomonas sp. Choline-3u-10]|jgi:aldose 1-epimerase|uniref:aldose 1-epimerase n=1 Tax=Pseudomonadaceae TaxID=135621 RepID=UPI000C336974|nr:MULTISPECIES: aldose 1-epimerase [Pseudomonadaceae]MAL34451.1 aldose epimerase [Pseudomonas sp.]MBU0950335.1 aldose 1-epimerase [Gammaproteobacteria bacterium]MBK3795671.1 aldose 1-epimerase [Stutzerimonas stutzeri]MBK3877974.1 aldose 1-epimerase [Stutzerimonas stutzeri]PKG92495.1 aldose 1-epimerase [Pseudomonas sp. Choline-3u-10]
MPELQPNLTEVELLRGPLRLSVCPGLGGAITQLSIDGIDLLRPWDGTDSVRRTGCFVLAPFSNRVGDGAFEHDGQRYPLRSLSTEHPLPIHGVAWKRAWTITEQSPTSLCLTLIHRPEGEGVLDWPFAFELEHQIKLDDGGVALQLTLRNIDNRSMPAGLGWHPYFLRHDACWLRFDTSAVWRNDTRNLPSQKTPIPTEWDFSTEAPLQEPGLDTCFVGRTGPVTIHWPNEGVELTMHPSEALDHLVVFTPPAEMGFFAVEPVSHANNALSMDDPAANGIRTLDPGETMQVSCRFSIARA